MHVHSCTVHPDHFHANMPILQFIIPSSTTSNKNTIRNIYIKKKQKKKQTLPGSTYSREYIMVKF